MITGVIFNVTKLKDMINQIYSQISYCFTYFSNFLKIKSCVFNIPMVVYLKTKKKKKNNNIHLLN